MAFKNRLRTDRNPNAIVGLQESMKGTKLAKKIEIAYGHLFAKWEKPTELIVFNPPWLPASHDLDRLDEAIYYNDKLFPEFFSRGKEAIASGRQNSAVVFELGANNQRNERAPYRKRTC